ncbi:DUF559 domain-containing protein [Microlunatus antarcticus]|uniref:DUF559 domain-containing protein n=1 Tax=Microlunatus antarcticus TaxID=53388 RepID=A0A7W5JYC8_9ACTN|nr:DUF559 domain-containing protein [Microlunatus antarcticus]MBB3328602.1 hypothetical protein [Microlunatus antarcticus]
MDPDLLDRCARARFHLPADAVLVGVTALQLYGVDVGDRRPVRASTLTRAQTRRHGVRLSRVRSLPPHRDGLARPAAAWCQAAADLDLVELVAAGDALLKAGLVTLPDLQAVAARAGGRGCRLVRRAAGLVRERVDSIPETRLRLCLVLAGLPEPRCNVVLGHGDRVIGRVDLLVEEFGLILEYDGGQHRERGQWNNDLDRDDAFSDADFSTIRVTRDRLRRPRELVRKIHARLVERGYRGPAPTFTPEWVAHFERRV